MKLKLRHLTQNDEIAFTNGLQDWDGEDLDWYTFLWKPEMQFSEMIIRLQKDFQGIELPLGRVAHSMLYGFISTSEGEKIVGRVSVRHELNESLLRRGGHIGYAVAPKYRKQGYATEMLRQGLEYCKKLNLKEVMISCTESNIGSWKLIEKFNGRLQEKFFDDEHQELCRRYWISLDSN